VIRLPGQLGVGIGGAPRGLLIPLP
jgi:hypothetical protein